MRIPAGGLLVRRVQGPAQLDSVEVLQNLGDFDGRSQATDVHKGSCILDSGPAAEKGLSRVFQGQRISTKRQGISTYEVYLDRTGRFCCWQVIRLSSVPGALVQLQAVARGSVQSYDKALKAAQAACEHAMQQHRILDAAETCEKERPAGVE
jgi:hypothetical protein